MNVRASASLSINLPLAEVRGCSLLELEVAKLISALSSQDLLSLREPLSVQCEVLTTEFLGPPSNLRQEEFQNNISIGTFQYS